VSALTDKVATLSAENETLKGDLVLAKGAVDINARAATDATAALEAATTKVAELETLRDTVAGERDTLAASLAAMTAELETFRAAAAATETARLASEKAATLAKRVEKLPEGYRAAHAKKSDEARSRVEAKWADMTDEAWDAYLADELLVGMAVASEGPAGMFLRKSREEGALTLGAGAGPSRKARINAILKK
jgi:chromosome segregation ATPase